MLDALKKSILDQVIGYKAEDAEDALKKALDNKSLPVKIDNTPYLNIIRTVETNDVTQSKYRLTKKIYMIRFPQSGLWFSRTKNKTSAYYNPAKNIQMAGIFHTEKQVQEIIGMFKEDWVFDCILNPNTLFSDTRRPHERHEYCLDGATSLDIEVIEKTITI